MTDRKLYVRAAEVPERKTEVIKVPLTHGQIALVSPEDADEVLRNKWCAKRQRNGLWYAARGVRQGGRQRTIFMHRQIMKPPPGMVIDHINDNGLDNRRENLRVCKHCENIANARVGTNGTSRFRGVHLCRTRQKWIAKIKAGPRQIYLGSFANPEDAARVYDAAALKYFGEFARPNFPRDADGNPVTGEAEHDH